jgi:hypothetical protein
LGVLSFGAGYGLGTAINQIPGVSEAITAALDAGLDLVYLAQNTKQQVGVVFGNIAAAQSILDKMTAAGGPGKDPDAPHHKAGIRAALQRAERIAQRLPTKLRQIALRKIQQLATQAGVTL